MISITNAIKTTIAIYQLWAYEQAHQVVDTSVPALADYWKQYYNSL
jgi:hypothetical protein